MADAQFFIKQKLSSETPLSDNVIGKDTLGGLRATQHHVRKRTIKTKTISLTFFPSLRNFFEKMESKFQLEQLRLILLSFPARLALVAPSWVPEDPKVPGSLGAWSYCHL